jgi:hypothetical protein
MIFKRLQLPFSVEGNGSFPIEGNDIKKALIEQIAQFFDYLPSDKGKKFNRLVISG